MKRGRCRRCGEDRHAEQHPCRGTYGHHGSDSVKPHDYTPDAVCGATARRLGKVLSCEEDAEHGGRRMWHSCGDFSWDDGGEPKRHALMHGRGHGLSDAQHNMISAAEMLEAADRIDHAVARLEQLLKRDRL